VTSGSIESTDFTATTSKPKYKPAQLEPNTKSELFTVCAITALTWPVEIGNMSLQKHISEDKRILDIWRTGLHLTKLESLAKSPNAYPHAYRTPQRQIPSTTHENRSAKLRRIRSTHHVTQHLYWQFCTPRSHWRILFAIFMLITPLIREPGMVVSTGRALVPPQANFNDLFIFPIFKADCFGLSTSTCFVDFVDNLGREGEALA
jgi:hypothetical protein